MTKTTSGHGRGRSSCSEEVSKSRKRWMASLVPAATTVLALTSSLTSTSGGREGRGQLAAAKAWWSSANSSSSARHG
ncbi:hypothetical protein E2562_023538 [Oryza meyeriana var. granulata]|uniref:Uncharacterized protein n=1 Tax=Oryza meyeriana var. granulata TaxID=110450 RepID=A0A6G1E1E2_9ORYZ|nr:hypothetical protein E2562_023538 [Oryza meyeriana var. granulata]